MIEEKLQKALQNVLLINEINPTVLRVLEDVRQVSERLGYVVGIVSSDGPDHVLENRQRLLDVTVDLRKTLAFPVFCSQEIFTPELYRRLSPQGEILVEFLAHWSDVLESGSVTDVFFAPRWQESKGSCIEHETAVRLGLQVTYL